VLADNKPQVRTAATEALDSIAPETGLESLLPHVAEALKPEGPILRQALLLWLAQRLKLDTKVTKEGVAQLLKPVILCLNDRSGGEPPSPFSLSLSCPATSFSLLRCPKGSADQLSADCSRCGL